MKVKRITKTYALKKTEDQVLRLLDMDKRPTRHFVELLAGKVQSMLMDGRVREGFKV